MRKVALCRQMADYGHDASAVFGADEVAKVREFPRTYLAGRGGLIDEDAQRTREGSKGHHRTPCRPPERPPTAGRPSHRSCSIAIAPATLGTPAQRT
jgi:hypothetical protein